MRSYKPLVPSKFYPVSVGSKSTQLTNSQRQQGYLDHNHIILLGEWILIICNMYLYMCVHDLPQVHIIKLSRCLLAFHSQPDELGACFRSMQNCNQCLNLHCGDVYILNAINKFHLNARIMMMASNHWPGMIQNLNAGYGAQSHTNTEKEFLK